jgi:hypothetical protein
MERLRFERAYDLPNIKRNAEQLRQMLERRG